jgi:pimeloyl-ACP methyl ester carboxylesterase
MQTAPQHLDLDGATRLAFCRTDGTLPEVVFLAGLRSDMNGAKAVRLEERCRGRGRAFTRFDYRGHGASSGRFEDGAVGDWLADTLAVLDRIVAGRPCVLAGSSMGGWLALLAALARPGQVRGLVGIAAAPDFTEGLIRARLSPGQAESLARDGLFLAPSAYGDPIPITRRLMDDGAGHLLLRRATIPLRVPVHLLHGQEDPDVPWQTSLTLAARLEGAAVTVELVKDGDHRLSREEDLRRIEAAVERVVAQAC